VSDTKRFPVGLIVTILEPADQALPDLVLDRRGDLPQPGVGARGDRLAGADAVWIGEVLQAQSGAQRLRPVVRGVAGDAAPAGVGVLTGAHEQRIVLLTGKVEVDGKGPAVEARV